MIEQVLLGLLSRRPMHGYELYGALQSTVGDVVSVNHLTQLYPFLRRMKDKGWVREQSEAQPGRPNRNVFSITPDGKREFIDWLSRPVDRRRAIHDEFLAKLRFSSNLDRQRTIELLDQQIAIYRQYKQDLERRKEAIHEVGPLPALLALEAGIRHSQTDIDWATWCKSQIHRQTQARKKGT